MEVIELISTKKDKGVQLRQIRNQFLQEQGLGCTKNLQINLAKVSLKTLALKEHCKSSTITKLYKYIFSNSAMW